MMMLLLRRRPLRNLVHPLVRLNEGHGIIELLNEFVLFLKAWATGNLDRMSASSRAR